MGQDTPIVEYLHKAKGLVNDFKNLSDPTKYFERKSEPKPGQKEFEEATSNSSTQRRLPRKTLISEKLAAL